MAQPMRRRLRVAAGALHDRLQDVIDAPLRNREHPIRAEASPRMASSEFVRLEPTKHQHDDAARVVFLEALNIGWTSIGRQVLKATSFNEPSATSAVHVLNRRRPKN